MEKEKLVYEEAVVSILDFVNCDIITSSSPSEQGGINPDDMGDWSKP